MKRSVDRCMAQTPIISPAPDDAFQSQNTRISAKYAQHSVFLGQDSLVSVITVWHEVWWRKKNQREAKIAPHEVPVWGVPSGGKRSKSISGSIPDPDEREAVAPNKKNKTELKRRQSLLAEGNGSGRTRLAEEKTKTASERNAVFENYPTKSL